MSLILFPFVDVILINQKRRDTNPYVIETNVSSYPFSTVPIGSRRPLKCTPSPLLSSPPTLIVEILLLLNKDTVDWGR